MTILEDVEGNVTNTTNDSNDGALTAVAIKNLGSDYASSSTEEGDPSIVSASAFVFTDEPKSKEDEILDDVQFVADDGEGNASIMRPRKPVVHTWGVSKGRNKMKKIGGNDDDEYSEYGGDDDYSVYSDDNTMIQYNDSKWHIVSAILFLFSSCIYLGMACMIMDTYWHYKDVPQAVYNADDDATWWNYFINCTDDAFFPEEVWNATDDYTWYEWYNETAFHEDDSVWLPKIADENAPGREPYVSKYMLLYFVASLGYLTVGIIEVVLARRHFWIRCLYYVMIVSALFGLVAATLLNKDPPWANICGFVSIHLWAFIAVVIFVMRFRGYSDADAYDNYEAICNMSIRKWFFLADFSLVVGTVGDTACSYFYIFGIDNWKMGITGVFFASTWLFCAIVYFVISLYDHIQYRKYFMEIRDEESYGKRDLPDIPLAIGGGCNNDTNNTNSGVIGPDTKKRDTANTVSSSSDSVNTPPASSINSLAENSGEDDGDENDKQDGDIVQNNSGKLVSSMIDNFFPNGQPNETNNESSTGTSSSGAVPDNVDLARSGTLDIVPAPSGLLCCAMDQINNMGDLGGFTTEDDKMNDESNSPPRHISAADAETETETETTDAAAAAATMKGASANNNVNPMPIDVIPVSVTNTSPNTINKNKNDDDINNNNNNNYSSMTNAAVVLSPTSTTNKKMSEAELLAVMKQNSNDIDSL